MINLQRLSHTRLTQDYLFNGQTLRTLCMVQRCIYYRGTSTETCEAGSNQTAGGEDRGGRGTVEKILADPEVVLNFFRDHR